MALQQKSRHQLRGQKLRIEPLDGSSVIHKPPWVVRMLGPNKDNILTFEPLFVWTPKQDTSNDAGTKDRIERIFDVGAPAATEQRETTGFGSVLRCQSAVRRALTTTWPYSYIRRT